MDVRELRKLQQAYSEVYEQQGILDRAIDAGAEVIKKPIENFANKKVGGIPGALGIPGAVAGQQVDQTAQQLKNKDFKGAFRTVTGGVRSLMQSTDLFDLVKGYLINEGYADTEESALVIMANMSEEWTQSIIEQQNLNEVTGMGRVIMRSLADAVSRGMTKTPLAKIKLKTDQVKRSIPKLQSDGTLGQLEKAEERLRRLDAVQGSRSFTKGRLPWQPSVIVQQTDPLKIAAENAAKRSAAFGSKKFQDGLKLSPSNPNSPNFDPKTLKTPGV